MVTLRCQRRMQTHQHPDMACLHDPVVVQPQRLYGCPAARCQAKHRPSVLTPVEMVAPSLLSRVKKWDHLPIMRIDSLSAGTFEFVAAVTGKAEIIKC